MPGWKLPENMDEYAKKYNKDAFLLNFPPEKRWEQIEGIMAQERSSVGDTLVSIAGRDHTGAPAQIWVDLPNAMYLFAMLRQVQSDLTCSVPTTAPEKTKPHP